MTESLKCQVCGQYATVHLTQIVNTQIHKVDLCEECARKKSVTSAQGFSLAELLAKSIGLEPPSDAYNDHACPHCNATAQNFKKTGRLGCAQCYDHLKDILESIIKNIHKDKKHVGKRPSRQTENTSKFDRIAELNKKIAQAVRDEKYEDAARYRDEINKIKATQ